MLTSDSGAVKRMHEQPFIEITFGGKHPMLEMHELDGI